MNGNAENSHEVAGSQHIARSPLHARPLVNAEHMRGIMRCQMQVVADHGYRYAFLFAQVIKKLPEKMLALHIDA